LHFVVFYALISSLTHTSVTLIPPPFQAHALPGEQTRDKVKLPPPVTTIFKNLVIQPPDYPPAGGYPDGDQIYGQPTDTAIAPLSPPHVVTRVHGGPGNGFPDTDDYYPSAAKRLEEQGISTVRVCVDTHGRLTSAPLTVQSAGSSRLDEGALQLARAGSGHYRASTEDGRAVDSCYAFRIRFQLKN
jgi:TonB family protein